MAESHADDPPEDLESMRKQNQALRQQLTADAERMQALERQTQQLQHQTQHPEGSTAWLLDWAIKRDRNLLLRDLAVPGLSPLDGKPLSDNVRTTLTAKVVRKGCFKFLSLSPELRNRIYELVANASFKAPCMVAYTPSGQRPMDVGSKFFEVQFSHIQRRKESGCWNRLAMLRVSRQINGECRQIFYRNMSLDLTHLHHQFSLKMMLGLIASPFRTRLQFVRHLELGPDTAQFILLSSPFKAGHKAMHEYWTKSVNSSTLSFKSIRRLRTLLFNLEAITVYQVRTSDSNDLPQSVGLRMALMLSQDRDHTLERLFPRLTDVVALNDHGGERLRKIGPRDWELHYSREKIPKDIREDFLELPGGLLVDTNTGLMHSSTISNMTAEITEDIFGQERLDKCQGSGVE